MIKLILRFLVRFLFRFRVFGLERLDTPGPVLLVPNHISWLDWVFLGSVLADDWKFVVSRRVGETSWLHHRIMLGPRAFPIDTTSPYAVKHMAEFLNRGGRLVLFAEGRISLTGSLMKLFDGSGFLLHKSSAVVIPAWLHGADRIRWVRHRGWRRWFNPVSLHVGPVLTPPRLEHVSAHEARRRLTEWLRLRLVEQHFHAETVMGPRTVAAAIIDTARHRPKHTVLEDFTLKAMNYRRLLIGADLLANRLEPRLPAGQPRVGVLLPNVIATPVVLLALWVSGRIPAVLNFTTGAAVLRACVDLAKFDQVITSRAFVERARLDLTPFQERGVAVIFLEDLRSEITSAAKIWSALRMTVNPGGLMRRRSVSESKSESADPGADTAVILFTSGSEGVPKGVELSHANLLANVRQMIAIMDEEDTDRLFNALPLFHSFGLTVGTLFPLIRGLYVFLYPSPLHYRLVPTAIYDRACTIFISTNTFLNGYARRSHPYDFRTVRYLFAAAEKLQEATATHWSRHFGVRVLEGYGATECGPCVSVNTALAPKYGTVGRLLPGMEARIEPVEGVDEGGRLFVRGPNIMKGYLNPDANRAFQSLDGWYDTGDIAAIDDEGYVSILGRLKRFAKISGEMVSLTAIEDALAGAFPEFGFRCQIAVLSLPDPDKGERLIAATNEPKLELSMLRKVLQEKGFTNLHVPREILPVREIPKLGTGKVHHRELHRRLFEENPSKIEDDESGTGS